MNENIDLTKILKDCPTGTKFYSSLFGEVEFHGISYKRIVVECIDCLHRLVSFNKFGKYVIETIDISYFSSECLLFPSKEQRDWSKFTAPWYKNDKFNPKTLKPFDKVLVRDSYNYVWQCDLFSCIEGIITDYKYRCIASCNKYCIPYNEDTKHLLNTCNLPCEYYIYWEVNPKME